MRGGIPRSPGRIFAWGMAGLVMLWLTAPVLVLLPLSFSGRRSFRFPPDTWSLRWYENFFTDSTWHASLLTSLKVGLLSTAASMILGTMAAFALHKLYFSGKAFVTGFLLAPMIFPGVVSAIAIFGVYLTWHISGTLTGFVAAHTVLSLPFVIVSVRSALRIFDWELEKAAASLGASPFETFRLVTLPLILPGVLIGGLFAFVISFDEVVVSLFLQTPFVRTLPVQMYLSVTESIDPTVAAASTIIVIVTVASILISMLFWQKRKTSDA
ncbi:ABC transporter permease [Shinella pollutisoli]|uniref:ABC transporter permease n=2 Tax=Shinella pollutisoli TaxID=2250594 RepID=A0ABV7DFV4_9HYPH|nr:ABC transporter permease [Shinella pollutisoli]